MTHREQIGSYRIVRQLGAGGMGTVYEAIHLQLGRRAAIKILRDNLAKDPQMASRFLNEARATNLIEHPSFVQIYEFGQLPDGTLFLVMEFLRGHTLRTRFESSKLPLGLGSVPLLRQLASALVAAHERGIIHRDLKPDNVMIIPEPEMPGGERVKVLDLGIAKLLDPPEEFLVAGPHVRTQTNAIMGTPMYMAPEQCHGASKVNAQADVYALGVILYQALSGTPPFVSDGAGALMAMHLVQAPAPLGPRAPGVPAALIMLVERMLAKVPTERPSMAQVAQELATIEPRPRQRLEQLPSPATPPAIGERQPVASTLSLAAAASDERPRSRHKVLYLLGATLIFAGGGAAAVRQSRQGDPTSVTQKPKEGTTVSPGQNLSQMCEGGQGRACFDLALDLDESTAPGSRDRAAQLYRKGCTLGFGDACFNLAVMYQDGVLPGKQQALSWFDQACTHGSDDGCKQTGSLLQVTDPLRALAAFEAGCEIGSGGSCTHAGLMLGFGKGVPQDIRRASSLYARGCELNEALACDNLGVIYDEGKGGVKRDSSRAAALYERACQRGMQLACSNLGWMLITGRGGIPKEPNRGVELLRRACDAGQKIGCKRLREAMERGTEATTSPTEGHLPGGEK